MAFSTFSTLVFVSNICVSKCYGPDLSPPHVKSYMPLYLLSWERRSLLSPAQKVLSRAASPLTIRHHASIMAYLPKTSVFWEYTFRDLWGMHVRCGWTCAHAWIHAFSLNKMEPYQLDQSLPVKSNTKSLSHEDSTEEHRSSTVCYGCFIWQHTNYVYLTPMQLCLAFAQALCWVSTSSKPQDKKLNSLMVLVCHNRHEILSTIFLLGKRSLLMNFLVII